MLKGGYTFEKYFVALPYIWGSWWPINGCCDQWSQSLACSLTYGSEPLVSQNALLVRREYPGNPSGKHIMHANGHNRMIVSTDPVVKKLTPWAIWRIVMRQNGNLNLTWQTPHQWQKGGGGGGFVRRARYATSLYVTATYRKGQHAVYGYRGEFILKYKIIRKSNSQQCIVFITLIEFHFLRFHVTIARPTCNSAKGLSCKAQ